MSHGTCVARDEESRRKQLSSRQTETAHRSDTLFTELLGDVRQAYEQIGRIVGRTVLLVSGMSKAF